MDILTSFKVTPNEPRNNEVMFALKKNAENVWAENVYIYCEDNDTVSFINSKADNEKIKPIKIESRLTYAFAVADANSRPGKITAIVNADVFLDETIQKIDFTDNDFVYCLTKSDYNIAANASFHVGLNYCFDAYVFRSPVRVELDKINFYFGLPGCDSIFAYELSKYMKVLNPSRIIRANHFHPSGYRTYTENNRLRGLYVSIDLVDSIEYDPKRIHTYSWCT